MNTEIPVVQAGTMDEAPAGAAGHTKFLFGKLIRGEVVVGLGGAGIKEANGLTIVIRPVHAAATAQGMIPAGAHGDRQARGKARNAVDPPSLQEFARGAAYESWVVGREKYALNLTTCTADDLPQASPIELEGFVPFLSSVG